MYKNINNLQLSDSPWSFSDLAKFAEITAGGLHKTLEYRKSPINQLL